MKRMALTFAAAAFAALIDAPPGHAYYEGPWCAYMNAGRDFYTSRCDLPNYQACRAEMGGLPGTWCTQNPRFRGPVERPLRVKKKQRSR